MERLTAEEMDERRQQNMAYEYLCHLEEAKRWIEACLNEDLPPTTELEEGLRNGVYLAKLGNFFAPSVVSLKRIYDREQTRYKATGLHFRHTDNIIQWLNAMTDKGLPKIFYPETTDIYDRKNMPRCIYCIHALSLYLFKLGLAPQITDLYGKVAFTEEEINNMKIELEKYNIQMPAFSKIGGILANELSVDEAALHAAVIAINDAIDHGVPEGTLAAMRNPNAMLLQLDESAAQQYQGTLFQAKTEKKYASLGNNHFGGHGAERDVYDELLTHAEIQGNINKADDRCDLRLQSVQAQNKGWYLKQLLADREQKEQVTGSILQNCSYVCYVWECGDPSAVLWLDEIQDAILRANKDSEDAIQAINETVDNKDSSQTLAALRSPAAGLYGVTSECAQTYQDDLFRIKEDKKKEGEDGCFEWMKHWVKGGHNYYYNLKTGQGTWEEPADFIPNNTELNKEEIQSVVSGVTTAYNREQLWLANESLIAKLQARCRGFLVRRGTKDRLGFLKSQEPSVTCIQAHWRGYKDRKKYSDRKQYLKDHADDAVKVRSNFDEIKDPHFLHHKMSGLYSLSFVHLLDHSDQDFQEELELMRLREEVITNIRSNQQLENDLNLMDIKIGLLVKNKITLQEVVSHSKKLTKKNKGELSNLMMMNKQKGGLKALSKEKREKLEAYQFLFYLLQTNPTYLAKLIFQMPQNKSTKFMDSVIFTLYNYASNQREEYLLLNLFKTALQEEIKSKVDHIQEIVTGNPTVIKMVVSFNRGARGQNALRQILAPVVKEIMDDKTLNIKTDPVDIYKSWVNQMESQTGEASKLPYDVTPEQAMSHEEVRTRLEASIKNMRTVTDKFLSAIIVSVDKIPYGMRFIAKILKDTLNERFPDATEDELLKIVGNLLYYRYMNPAIVAPDAFDIIDLSAGGQLTTEQRRNLGSIAKMLQHAASNKMFLGDNAHLNPINEYLSNSYQKFRRFFLSACDVPSLEDKFNVDQYSDLVTLTKPVIYISIGEIINTHTLLLDHQDAIAPDHNDPIHELLDDLGEVPTIESLIGEPLRYTEVSLTLTNKFDVPDKANAEMDAKTLLLNTKRLIVDVIRFQPGETLTEILETVASPEQETEYQRAMQRRAIRDAKTPEKMKQAKPVVDDSLTLQGKKDKIKSNLQRLGELGKVHPEKKYQDLINDISKDIRNQRRYRQRRKAELVKLQQTNAALNSKTNFYNVQIDYYNQYIKTCMDNLARKGKYKNVIFEISPSEVVGVFDVKAKLMGVHLETLMLEYQVKSYSLDIFRVLSHLARCFGTWRVSPLSSVRLGICEHGNRARIRAKTIGPRSPERGGLGSTKNELWSGSVVVRKQSDLTDQRTRLYHNGNG
uniref:Ras GTPase-activating-like protein IQGAP1 n=1 Tax=Sinocyclocheilus grahami TaxID=75366 RepID=A0A672LIY2_SINGR